ncbi:MAG: winged helix-turn-helix domain-containing protein, partial [Pyrinomonadaceae bacterium]|nr:winged helix-turn-helix domain-containing protein [Pyrinomonadaceae bacterium]
MENQIIKFDSFTLDLSENILLKNNRPIKITKKAFQMLVYLANRPNELIPSEALLKEIWSEGSANLSRLLVNVTTIRNILGKKEDGTDYILNQPKKGYIFNCYVIKNNSSQNQLKEIPSQDNLSFNNFIGRTQELETLKLEVENLLKNVGNAVLIQGEIGIGKTTFIQKFIEATNKPRVFVKRFFHFVADKTPEYEVFFKL